MAFKKKFLIPLKYKFVGVIMVITLSAIGVFFYFTNRVFSEDKRLFVMDLNLTLLRAATSEIKLELRTRLEELQALIPRVYRPAADGKKVDLYEGLSPQLKDEVVRVRIMRRTAPEKGTPKIDVVREYINADMLSKRSIKSEEISNIDTTHPLDPAPFFAKPGLELKNRSFRLTSAKTQLDVAILTFLLPGSFVDSESTELLIIVDMFQDFLRKKLNQSEVAQLFLILKDGSLFSHPQLSTTVSYANKPFPHPIVQRLQSRVFPRESFEMTLDNEPYLMNLSETGFQDVFAVSQIKKSDAFTALRMLMEKSILTGALILCIAIIVSLLFAARLTSNIQKLKLAAEQIGQGNLRVRMRIHSNDEIQSVSESFQWMTNRLAELIQESAQKARMEEELETARLVQSTLLAPPRIETNAVEIDAVYVPASECGGDVWDAQLDGNILTLFIADATGHGAPAAIVTAVAKSCFNTLNTIYAGQPLTPDQYLTTLNQMIFNACKGKLLMTMCIAQLNLDTGELVIGNAGHEAPLCLRHDTTSRAQTTDKKRREAAEVLFARGERLGFDINTEYLASRFYLSKGDTVLLYTDGVSEAENMEGKEWGERALKKTLAQGGPREVNTIKTQIMEKLTAHTQGVPQTDDITFVLLRLKRDVRKKSSNDEAA